MVTVQAPGRPKREDRSALHWLAAAKGNGLTIASWQCSSDGRRTDAPSGR